MPADPAAHGESTARTDPVAVDDLSSDHPIASPNVWPTTDQPVQDAWPANTCYGCGPANPDGLHVESYLSDDRDALVATFDPEPTHAGGYPHFAYGGLLASLADCHSIWTAMTFRYADQGRELLADPLHMYVTGELNVRYLTPTPLDDPIHIRARVDDDPGRKTTVVCELGPENSEPTVRTRATAVELQNPPALDAASDWPHAQH